MPSKNRGERNVAVATAPKEKESPCRGEHPRRHIVLPLPPSRSCHFNQEPLLDFDEQAPRRPSRRNAFDLKKRKQKKVQLTRPTSAFIPSHLPPPPPLPLPDRVRSTKTQGHGYPPPPTRPYPTRNQIKRTQSSSCVTW